LKNAPLSDPTYCRQLAGLQAPGDAAAILVSSAIALSAASIALMDLSETLAPLADVPGVAQTSAAQFRLTMTSIWLNSCRSSSADIACLRLLKRDAEG
jgi:hypothetical protein